MKNLILITFLSLLTVVFSQKSIETFTCGSSTFQIMEGKLFNLNNNVQTKVNTGAKNITCFSTDGKNIVLGTLYQGIFLSRDYGLTWEKNVIETYHNFYTKNILSLHIDFHRIYAMVNTGKFQLLYFTKDYGKSWETKRGIESAGKQELDLGEGPTSVKKLEIDTNDNYIIAVCANESKYITEGKGETWVKCDSLKIVKIKSDYRQRALDWQKNPLNHDRERFKEFDGGHKYCELTLGEFLYAGTGKGLFRSKDKGKTWEKINNGIHDNSIWKIYQFGDNIIIHTHDEMSYFSSNYGDSWEELKFEYATGSLKNVVANSRTGFMLMDKGLYVSKDLGHTWGFLDVKAHELYKFGDNILIHNNQGFHLFNDGQMIFNKVNDHSFEFIKFKDNVVYAISNSFPDLYVYLSNDFGVTWTKIDYKTNAVTSTDVDILDFISKFNKELEKVKKQKFTCTKCMGTGTVSETRSTGEILDINSPGYISNGQVQYKKVTTSGTCPVCKGAKNL